MTRRKARENAFITLFAVSFGNTPEEQISLARAEDETIAVDDFGEGLVELYQNNAGEVDRQIEARLKGWKVRRLSRVSLAVLRLSVAELLFGGEDMDSVVINEAVEITKRYGSHGDHQFVNGLLGALARDAHGDDTRPQAGRSGS